MFLDTDRLAGASRLVDPLYYRERLASLFDVYGRLATLSHGLYEVLYLVAMRHREAARVRARAWAGIHLAVALHDLFRLVLASSGAVRLPLLSLASDVEEAEALVVTRDWRTRPKRGGQLRHWLVRVDLGSYVQSVVLR